MIIGFRQYWYDVAAQLSEMGADIVYWIGDTNTHTKMIAQLSDIPFHDTFDATRGIPAQAYSDATIPPPDNELMEAMSGCEAQTLKMLDRLGEPKIFAYYERVRHYHRILGYWDYILKTTKPDGVIFTTAPHTGYDFVLYSLCKHHGIKTTLFEKTPIPGLVVPVARFEEGNPSIRKRATEIMASEGDISLSAQSEKYLEGVLGDHGTGAPIHFQNKIKKTYPMNSVPKELYRIFRNVYKRSYEKYPFRKLESPGMTRLQDLVKTYSEKWTIKKLHAHYQVLCSQPDLSKPFILVALQCQPERAACPSGAFYAHQELMVAQISACAPDGWQVYVKEHPSQFKPYQKPARTKTLEFYDDINVLPNVTLIPTSIDTFKLIDNAKAVATVSGSVGFEAAVRGTPSLSFGYAWYRGTEGIFRVMNREDLVHAIKKIRDGYRVDARNTRVFIKALEEKAMRGYLGWIYKEHAGVDEKENIKSIALAIQNILQL